MADAKISQLTAASSTDGTEVLPIVQSATTKKLAISKIRDYLLATANVFVKPQTFQPDSDGQAGTFRRYDSSQTAKVVEIQSEANAVLASIDKDGKIATPAVALGTAGTTSGVLTLSGSTSGTVTVQPAAAAGTYALTLPTSDGDASQVLTTDGSGVLSWTTPSTTLTANSTATSGGAAGQILYDDGSKLQESSSFTFNATNPALTLAGGTAATATLSNVQVTGTGGQFSCNAASSTLTVGQVVTITGTNSGTATITGYTSPAQFVISATNGSTTFTLQGVFYNVLGGANRYYPVSAALTTTAGTTTGLTFSYAPSPALALTQTFNSSSTDFVGLRVNATNTASATTSWLADLQTAGSSVFRVSTDGTIYSKSQKLLIGTTTVGTATSINICDIISGYTESGNNTFEFKDYVGGTARLTLQCKFLVLTLDSGYTFRIGTDTALTRKGAASFQFGSADAAAPVAQTLGIQSVVAGTSNTAGVNWTLRGSQGTGTGAGGSIILRVAPAGSSGTAQNALTDALTISAAKTITAGDAFDLAFGTTTGSKIGTATDQKIAFWNATPVAQQVLATGASKTVDDVITLLQTLGLCKQS